MKEQYVGMLGHYGISTDAELNKSMIEANKLVDEYNQNVSSYETIDEQSEYQRKMNKKIKKTLKGKK